MKDYKYSPNKETERILTRVEATNTLLVENHIEHLDVIIDALTFAIGANLRVMSEDNPNVLREHIELFLEHIKTFTDKVIEDAEEEWQQRTIN